MKKSSRLKGVICFLILIAGAITLTIFMYEKQYIASGKDIWGHLFKSDLLYQSLKEGNAYPLYTKLWYNGIQPFRYWAPFPYYIMAALQFVAGGNIMVAYCLFGGLSFLCGGLAWFLWGRQTKRYVLCLVIGMLWFFMPENFRVYLCEGNLPRMVTTFLIPFLAYFVWRYVRTKKLRHLSGIVVVTMLITLSHAMIAAMSGIMVFVFLLFDCKMNRTWREGIRVIITMLLSFAMCGIWLVPALQGGLVGMDPEAATEVMSSLAYSLKTSLNPMNRITGIVDTFYYGISFLVLAFVGILLGKSKRKAGFFTTFLILILTTPSFVPVLSKIPLSQLLWMMRFATLAYAFFLWSWIEWKTLKKKYCVVFVLLLIIDCIPSFVFKQYYTQSSTLVEDNLTPVKAMTKQRATLLDVSLFGSYPSWELCTGDDKVSYGFGWAWQGATTADNIVLLNSSLENERYAYMFDRCVELGNDTILYMKSYLGKNGGTKEKLMEAASLSGYNLIKETNTGFIFHKETPETFGVRTKYRGIGIGKYAKQIGLYYPAMTIGDTTVLDDYSFDELKQYETIFLSGFTYHSIDKAENLVDRLSHSGVKVVIDMTHLPVDKKINRMHFLDVTMQDISFSTRFPVLHYNNTVIDTLDFSEDYKTWNTGYIEGVPQPTGSFLYSNQELCFLGNSENGNITFVGLNLLFHAMETEDKNILTLFSDLMGIRQDELPSRECVPIQVDVTNQGITIQSEYDDLNTTLAALSHFRSDQNIQSVNNLLMVQKGTTKIRFVYPSFAVGFTISCLGIVFYLLYLCFIRRSNQKQEVSHE